MIRAVSSLGTKAERNTRGPDLYCLCACLSVCRLPEHLTAAAAAAGWRRLAIDTGSDHIGDDVYYHSLLTNGYPLIPSELAAQGIATSQQRRIRQTNLPRLCSLALPLPLPLLAPI